MKKAPTPIYISIIILLLIAVGILSFLVLTTDNNDTASHSTTVRNRIITKADTPDDLHTYLQNYITQHDQTCAINIVTVEGVVNNSQARIHHVCNDGGQTIYLQKHDTTWKMLSLHHPDKTTPYGLPSCDDATKYNISQQLAPACKVYNSTTHAISYTANPNS